MRVALILTLLIASLHAQDTSLPSPPTSDLEAEVEKNLPTTPAGAEAMLALITRYEDSGQIFGLIRTAEKFASAQPAHPRHQEVVLGLLAAYQITSRDAELIAGARQFLKRHPESAEAAKAERLMAAALERTGNRLQAAQAFHNVWVRLGGAGVADALHAVELYREINQQVAHEAIASIADTLADQLPPRPAAELAWQGTKAARRYQNWTLSNSIAERMLRRKLPIGKQREPDLHFLIGENKGAEGKHQEAITHYKKSLALRASAETSRRLINAYAHSEADPSSWLPPVSEHLKNFPDDPERFTTMAQLAYAFHERKNTPKAIEVVSRLFPTNIGNPNLPSQFVGWSEDYSRSGKILKAAMAKNRSDGAWRLRWALG
ncbi:MAG: hypothetical protein ACR2RV_24220, partial [Verrucomicrobiales bacterium]